MVTAVKLTDIVEVEKTVTELQTVNKVVLTLDEDVARSLYAITGHIGGGSESTYRGDWDKIAKALRGIPGLLTSFSANPYGRFSGNLEAKVRAR
jgi:hypothetical protein